MLNEDISHVAIGGSYRGLHLMYSKLTLGTQGIKYIWENRSVKFFMKHNTEELNQLGEVS